ncbi:unnamed protein product [Brassicogethes aeneus]|uniref:Integrase core domain-containing protein n=1 Tax=Brassicogethes aeneus TaxID=1431903 RepID=A0A9P0BJ87_BRAAE|nr:unnamed protein product [Brassicogethes aeneus]
MFGNKSFIYGTSQCNQRIESWWSMLRKHSAQFWMNLFQGLKEDGHFTGSALDKALIQFCFLGILQEELDQIVYEWNTHSISGSRNAVSPRGRPVIIFELPELYHTTNFLCDFDNQLIEACERECQYFKMPCETDIYELCKILMNEKNIEIPQDAYAAAELYLKLKSTFLEFNIN